MHLERADGPVPAGLPILELHGRVVVGPPLPRAEVGGAAAVLALLLRVGVRAHGVDPLACLGLGLGLGLGLRLGFGLGSGLGLRVRSSSTRPALRRSTLPAAARTGAAHRSPFRASP